jgi:hypothetical protein
LERLTDNELFALCKRLILLHSSYYGTTPKITDENILAFLKLALNRMGSDEMITPREITRDFLNVLDILYSDPTASFETLIEEPKPESETDEDDDFFDLSDLSL